ncbi:MAG: T9SS type A sorting domain-containing protein, partial [Chitinophagales bacterium]|nr:T9SS type A sorting domain-containing protein [Chitinophagales bacterium]
YTLTVSSNNSCTASSDSILITALPLPTAPIITRTQDTLFATPAYSYQWYVNQAAINGATENKLNLTQSGDYYVEITDTAGCQNRSQILNVNGVQINDVVSGYNFELYPNPNQGQVTIKHSYNGYLNLQIVNALGMVAKAFTIQHPVSVLNINELAKGVYWLVATNDNNERKVLKMVKN